MQFTEVICFDNLSHLLLTTKLSSIPKFVVYNVRILLSSLKGSPAGLKLNVELNNFFLNCFTYHVDLWATFLGKCVEMSVGFELLT